MRAVVGSNTANGPCAMLKLHTCTTLPRDLFMPAMGSSCEKTIEVCCRRGSSCVACAFERPVAVWQFESNAPSVCAQRHSGEARFGALSGQVVSSGWLLRMKKVVGEATTFD